MNPNIKQLRLSDGSEIIAELIEEVDDEVLVRVPLHIVKVDLSYNRTVYTFKPYMTYVEYSDTLVSLNLYHIIAIAIPHEDILAQYQKALKKIQKIKEDGDELYTTDEKKIADSIVEGLTGKKRDSEKDFSIPEDNDSSSSNVIYVPFSTDKDKMH